MGHGNRLIKAWAAPLVGLLCASFSGAAEPPKPFPVVPLPFWPFGKQDKSVALNQTDGKNSGKSNSPIIQAAATQTEQTTPGTPDPATDPVLLASKAVAAYESLNGCIMRFTRRENLGKGLKPDETVLLKMRREPFAVHMKWLDTDAQGRQIIYNRAADEHSMQVITASGDIPLIGGNRRMKVDEFDSGKMLAHAAKQAKMRGYDKFPIVDVDAHHYENEHYHEVFQYIESPVIKNIALESVHRGGRASFLGGQVGYQERAEAEVEREVELGQAGAEEAHLAVQEVPVDAARGVADQRLRQADAEVGTALFERLLQGRPQRGAVLEGVGGVDVERQVLREEVLVAAADQRVDKEVVVGHRAAARAPAPEPPGCPTIKDLAPKTGGTGERTVSSALDQ